MRKFRLELARRRAVTIVLTLVVRDEEEIIEENIDHHLRVGVDLVLVTDHRSEDRTPEILDRYAREGTVRVFRADDQYNPQQAWQTRMARLAFADHGADWVLLGDADEFWWPHGESLPDALCRIPDQYGSVRGLQRNFVPIRDDAGHWVERMVVRLSTQAPINDPATPFRPVVKVAVRAAPDLVVGRGGGHEVFGILGAPLVSWHPLEVLHFPLRTREQCTRKYEKTWTGWQRNLRGDLSRAQQTTEDDRPDAMWRRLALDESDVERGFAEGSLAVDTRLRDAYRAARDGSHVDAGNTDGVERDRHRHDVEVFSEAELVRRQRWVDGLTRRVRAREDASRSGRRLRAR